MILKTCTPYFREIIAKADNKKKEILFKTACRIFGPQLHSVDAYTFCKELGVSMDYAPLYKQCVSNLSPKH